MRVQKDDYYPFGMTIPESVETAGYENKNLYNSKELMDEHNLNVYDYGARNYDPQLGRWWQVDPADEFNSPYVYVGNMPTIAVDPDGEFSMFATAALAGATDIAIQCLEHKLFHNKEDFEVNWGSVGISVVAGATGAGVVTKIDKLYKLGKMTYTASKVTSIVSTAVINASADVTNQMVENRSTDLSKVDFIDTGLNVGGGLILAEGAGALVKKTGKYADLKETAKDLARYARNNPKPTRIKAAKKAQETVENFVEIGASAGATTAGVGSIIREHCFEK